MEMASGTQWQPLDPTPTSLSYLARLRDVTFLAIFMKPTETYAIHLVYEIAIFDIFNKI